MYAGESLIDVCLVGELSTDVELFNAEAVEYFQLKQQMQTASLLRDYLASTNEALSIVAGMSSYNNLISLNSIVLCLKRIIATNTSISTPH